MTTRQDAQILLWWENWNSAKRARGEESAGMSLKYLELEAAAYFGCASDEFARKRVARRAEMMAHVVMKNQREMYVMETAKKEGEKKRGGFNPMEAQHRIWLGQSGKQKAES